MGDHMWTVSADRDVWTSMVRRPDLRPLETFYNQIDVSGGYRYHWNTDSFWQRGIGFQAHYSRITGARQNNHSHRDLLGIQVDFKQYFSSWIFLSPALIMGYADNHLNFGTGIPLPDQNSLNIKIKPTVGVEHCFHRLFCPALTMAYSFERDIAGDPPLRIQSLSVGVAVTGSLQKAPEAATSEDPIPTSQRPSSDRERKIKRPGKAIPKNLLAPIAFSPTQRGLTDDHKKQLNRLATALKEHPNTTLLIKGYSVLTDETTEDTSKQLDRVDAANLAVLIQKYLVDSQNVPINQVSVIESPIKTMGRGVTGSIGKSVDLDEAPSCDRCVIFVENEKP